MVEGLRENSRLRIGHFVVEGLGLGLRSLGFRGLGLRADGDGLEI